MFWQSQWNLFEPNWYITLTMIFGSFVAGVSSEGGGAIAYRCCLVDYGQQGED